MSCGRYIEVIIRNFDLQATADLYVTEYYLVTQPKEGQSGEVLFVYKNPDGTANPPILIPSGKQVNKLIKEFQRIFEKKYNSFKQE